MALGSKRLTLFIVVLALCVAGVSELIRPQPAYAGVPSYVIRDYMGQIAPPAFKCSQLASCTSYSPTFGTVTATNFIATAGSGANGFAVSTNGARFDFGAGASDYASSNGTTVTFAGPVASASTGAFAGVTSTIASGSNAFGAATNGSRVDFGAGTSDYANSDGTTVTYAGPVSVTGALQTVGAGTTITSAGTSVGYVMQNNASFVANGATATAYWYFDGTSFQFSSPSSSAASLVLNGGIQTGANYWARFQKVYAAAPTAGDCDAAGEVGRVAFTTDGYWCVCTTTSGWLCIILAPHP